jgi:predicted GNAT family N-acyltransferase
MTERFKFRVVARPEVPLVLQLRDEVYSSGLGKNPDDGWDNVGAHLAAYGEDGAMVAAFRVLDDSLRPFEFERFHPLDSLLSIGRHPAMIGKLCVRSAYRNARSSTRILFGLLNLALEFAETVSITDYYIYALPHLVRLYRRASFAEIGVQVNHGDWGCVELMHMNVGANRSRPLR